MSVYWLHGVTFQKTLFFTATAALAQHNEQIGCHGYGNMQAMSEKHFSNKIWSRKAKWRKEAKRKGSSAKKIMGDIGRRELNTADWKDMNKLPVGGRDTEV